MQFDQILGLAAGVVEPGVDVFGAGFFQRGDDVADIQAEQCGLDAGDDTELVFPGLGGVTGLGEATHGGRAGLGTLDADGIDDVLDLGGQGGRAGDAEQIVEAVFFTKVHEFGWAIVTVAPDGQMGVRPVTADAQIEAAQIAGRLLARRRLARTQDHRHRAAGGGVIDVDRQEAALVMVGVEQRLLLGSRGPHPG